MSFQIARVRDIPIRLHFTLLIAFVVIAWTLATGFMPLYFPGLDAAQYWIMGGAGAVVLFISIFLHELMHSVVAQKYGIKVRQIILFIFGGVSEIPEETRDFGKEFKIAVAGPLTSFAIAGGLAAAWWLVTVQTGGGSPPSAVTLVEGVLLYGAIINALVGGFNLIPAFPLDGGRLLRAGLVRWKRNYDDATRIAAKVGIGISYGFMALGFFLMVTGSFLGGIWILLIGWFLNSGAQSYLSQHELTSSLSGVYLKDIMNSRVISVPESTDLNTLLRDYFGRFMKSAFPVTDGGGRLVGMVDLRNARSVPEDRRMETNAADIMVPVGRLAVLGPERRGDDALRELMRKQAGRIFVCDNHRILLGLISKTDILNVANEQSDYHRELQRKEISKRDKDIDRGREANTRRDSETA
ncbi:MAG TPA: site-2 protease family protein [Nitrososphaera sp.]|nr:site-2 protease family protein [Nitrososphaera sp.]